jgi:hypothetical protein
LLSDQVLDLDELLATPSKEKTKQAVVISDSEEEPPQSAKVEEDSEEEEGDFYTRFEALTKGTKR